MMRAIGRAHLSVLLALLGLLAILCLPDVNAGVTQQNWNLILVGYGYQSSSYGNIYYYYEVYKFAGYTQAGYHEWYAVYLRDIVDPVNPSSNNDGFTVAGKAGQSATGGGVNPVIWAILRGVYFAVSIVVLLTGVRMFVSEIIPAFRGFAMKIVPGAKPAVDCPVVFPQAPTAVIIGFISGLIVFLVFMGIFLVTGFAVIVPPMIMLFFPGGAAAVFGNRRGGWKGAVLGGAINGLILAIGQALTLPALTHAPELATLADPDWYVIIWLLKGILSPLMK
ncbi:MAG: PTS transporter subunit IIC [Desulfurococcaceae archaeon]